MPKPRMFTENHVVSVVFDEPIARANSSMFDVLDVTVLKLTRHTTRHEVTHADSQVQVSGPVLTKAGKPRADSRGATAYAGTVTFSHLAEGELVGLLIAYAIAKRAWRDARFDDEEAGARVRGAFDRLWAAALEAGAAMDAPAWTGQ